MTFQAIKDPKFEGAKSFDGYTLIRSRDIGEHLRLIKETIFKNKPEDKEDVVFYSMPDAKGMRFMREMYDGGFLSDFRWEWL